MTLQSIISVAGHDFARIRIGVSKDGQLNTIIPPSREMNLLGHGLDMAGQAIQSLMSFNDIKVTKKKYAHNTKLPTTLRELPGLLFPVLTVDLSAPAPAPAPEATGKGKGKATEEKVSAKPAKPAPEKQSSSKMAGASVKK